MTDLTLRPLSLGESLGRASTLFGRRAGAILASVLAAMVLPTLMIANRIPHLLAVLGALQRNPGDREALRAATELMGGMFLVAIVGAVGFVVARSAVAWIAHKALLGDAADAFEALEKGLRFLPSMLALLLVETAIYVIAAGVLYFVGALLVLGQLRTGAPPSAVPLIAWVLSIYGAMVFITTGLFVTPPILLAEDGARVFGTVGRSFALTKGRRGAIFGGILAIMLVSTLAYLAVDIGLGALMGVSGAPTGQGMLVLVGANLVLNLFTMSFYFVFQMVVYYDLRIRKEGLDEELAPAAAPAKPR